MTARVAISSNRISVVDVWEYYESVRAAIVQSAETAKQSLVEGDDLQDSRLFGMNMAELNAHFASLLDEADKQVCLFLIAGAEAAIRVDFFDRVYGKRKDPVSRAFHNIYNSRRKHDKTRVRLEEDILNTWTSVSKIGRTRTTIGTFKGALKFRHWLAHGRWWIPKLGRKYDPIGIVQIIMDLFGVIGLSIDE